MVRIGSIATEMGCASYVRFPLESDRTAEKAGLAAIGVSTHAALVSASGVPPPNKASIEKGSMLAWENRPVVPSLLTAAAVIVAGAAVALSWFQACLNARRCPLRRSASMLNDPAPKVATWNRPPAMATFLKKWIIWF